MYENILIKNFKLLEKRKGKKDKIWSRSEDVTQWHKACLASTSHGTDIIFKTSLSITFLKNVWESGETRTMAVDGGQRTARSSQFSPSAVCGSWDGIRVVRPGTRLLHPLSHLTSPGHHHLKIRSYMESFKKHGHSQGHSRVWEKLATSTASHHPARVKPLERYI